ncbi:MAG: C10 family peptidase, partial [Muribaculaceae bacterium]|nr:C10 family peptidase [Muribaculaceae bacterium]
SFTYGSGTMGQYITQSTEALPVTTFDWAHMKDTYNGSEDQVYTDAVAKLMLYVGHAAHSTYTPSASGTSDPYVPKAFNTYLDYNATLVYRSDYDQDSWTEMVYEELVAGRPMIYNGRAGSGGHSFVCDGYEFGDYYHINWGWGGLGDGYFQLAILNPYAAGIGASTSSEGYSIDQTAIIGITPGYTGQPEQVNHVLTVFNMYYNGNRELEKGSNGFSLYKRRQVVVSVEDHIGDGTKYKTGIALYDSNNNFVQLIASTNIYSSSYPYTDQWPTSNSSTYYYFGKNLSNGTYKIVPVCQVQNSSEWIPMLESDRYYIAMTVNGNYATLVDHPLNDLTATNFEFVGDHRVGGSEKCNVTVRNNSDDRFLGKLYLYVNNERLDELSEYTSVNEAEIPAHGTKVITYNFTPQNAGTKSAQLSLYDSSWGGSMIPGTGNVTISAAAETVPMNLSVVIEATNAIDGVIYDSHARFKVDVTNNANGEYNRYLLAPLFIVENGKGTMITYQQTTLRIPAHETVTLYYDFDNLAYGSTYALNMYGRNENEETVNLVESGHSVFYNVSRGLVTWDGTSMVGNSGPASGNITIPADALAASLEGLDITSVTPSGNPNTIYFIGENESVPSGLAGLNVVKGNTAQNIMLVDGNGFFTPQSFTAQSISYERTFDKARRDGVATNWSTIVLPFTPATITANGNNIDWYRSSDETGKALWLMNFAREEDNAVTFDYAQNMEANVPYIIAIDDAAGLTGKTITWSATNALIKPEPIAHTSGEVYIMTGSFVNQSLEDIYAVNAGGSDALWSTDNQDVASFRAYFKELAELDNHNNIPLPGEPQQIEEVTLAIMIANGTIGNDYSITNPLTVVYVSPDGMTLYAKDDNEFALQNQVPYVPTTEQVDMDYVFDDVTQFDQSNWVAINLPEAVENPEYCVNKTITGVEGTLNDLLNPEMTVTEMPTFGNGNTYAPNLMCVANFANENTYFLVPPKPMEYVHIRWAVYKNGKFYMPASGENGLNDEGMSGAINANTDMLDYTFINNNVYEIYAVVKALSARSASSAPHGKRVNIEPSETSSYYEISPVSVHDIITGINTINADRGNNVYYNLLGQPV